MAANAPKNNNNYRNHTITLKEILEVLAEELDGDPRDWFALGHDIEPRLTRYLADLLRGIVEGTLAHARFKLTLADSPAADLASRAGHSAFVCWIDDRIEFRFIALGIEVGVLRNLGMEQATTSLIGGALAEVEETLASHRRNWSRSSAISSEELADAQRNINLAFDVLNRFQAGMNSPETWCLAGELNPANIIGAYRVWRPRGAKK